MVAHAGLRCASVGPRAAAVIVDVVMTFICFGVPLSIASGGAVHEGSSFSFNIDGGWALLLLLLMFGYFVASEAMFGTTVGKRALNLRVCSIDGEPIGWGAATTRNLMRLVDGFPYVLPYLLGAVAVWSDGYERQRLGDRTARTVVVYR